MVAKAIYKPRFSFWPFLLHKCSATFFLWLFYFMKSSGIIFSVAYLLILPMASTLLFLIAIYPTINISSGWLIPGYALFNVYFVNEGSVWMCATRTRNNVLIIKTSSGKK
jgi:hypothetical protein